MAIRRPAAFAELLRRHRFAAGLTQEELAERSGLSVRGLSDIERGISRTPYRATAEHLADALGLQGETRAQFVAAARGRAGTTAQPGESVRNAAPQAQHSTLIGRAPDEERIDLFLQTGLPPALVLAGEPGIGKSRLLHYAAGAARDRGMEVLQAGCRRRSGEEPYAPLVHALAAFVESQSPRRLKTLLHGCGWLIRLLPELGHVVPAPMPLGTVPVQQERRLLFTAVQRFLQNLAGREGVLLLLDDLQWAGVDGLDLINALVRDAEDGHLHVLGAYRHTEVGDAHPLETLLADLAHSHLVDRHPVPPLQGDAARELLDTLLVHAGGDSLDVSLREDILERAGGVPFYLVSYVQGIAALSHSGARVPWTVAQSIRQRMAMLARDARDVLDVASIVGRSSAGAVLQEVTGLDDCALSGAMRAACTARLLEPDGSQRYRFPHDVIREVVEEGLEPGRRALLHREVGESLERASRAGQPAQWTELAWHFREGGDVERAFRYCLKAGDDAMSMYAATQAEQQYRFAVSLARDNPRLGSLALALEGLSSALEAGSNFAEAAALLDEAADLYRDAGDFESETRAIARLGWTLFYSGASQKAREHAEAILAGAESRGPSRALAELYIALTFLWFADAPDDTLRAAERAAEIARQLDDRALLVQAEVRRGLSLGRTGRWEEGASVLDAAAIFAEEVGDAVMQAHALGFSALAFYIMSRPRDALERYRGACAVLDPLGYDTLRAYGVRASGNACFVLGDWKEARRAYERALQIDREAGPSTFSSLCPAELVKLSVAEGRWEDAERYAAEMYAVLHNEKNDRPDTNVQGLLAEMDLMLGKREGALARLQPIQNIYACSDANYGIRVSAVEVCLALEDLDTARQLLHQSREILERQNNTLGMPAWHRAHGMVLGRMGDIDAASRAFGRAVSLAASMPYPLEQGRALLEWGTVLRQADRADEARCSLEEALSIFHTLGAAPYVERAEYELRVTPVVTP